MPGRLLKSTLSPHPETALFYPATGILGELGTASIGVGYTLPFQLFAAPWIDGPQLARRMNSLRVPGVSFRPIYLKPFYASFKGEFIQGVQVHLTDIRRAPLSELQFLFMQEIFPRSVGLPVPRARISGWYRDRSLVPTLQPAEDLQQRVLSRIFTGFPFHPDRKPFSCQEP